MSTGLWVNNDNLVLEYGTQKALPEQGGDFLQYGQTRLLEVYIDLVELTSSPLIQSFNTFFPAGSQTFIEQVEVMTEIAATGGTTFSVGLGYPTSSSTYSTVTEAWSLGQTQSNSYSTPSVTAISNTAFINAMVIADVAAAGQKTTLNEGSTYAGGYIGSTSASTTHPNYVTALAAGTFTAGQIRVRIMYRGVGAITQ
jgi:hypothetical protein